MGHASSAHSGESYYMNHINLTQKSRDSRLHEPKCKLYILGQSQNPHAVSGQLQASLLQPFNIGSHYTHPVSFLY